MKHRKINENKEKKSFVYRIQSLEKPLWLNYYQDFDGYYLSIPNEVAEAINKEIETVIDPKYKIKIEENEYNSISIGVKLYELREKVGTNKVTVSDIAIRFNEYTFGNKKGLSKTVLDCKISEFKRNYLAADDFFDDPFGGESETKFDDYEEGLAF